MPQIWQRDTSGQEPSAMYKWPSNNSLDKCRSYGELALAIQQRHTSLVMTEETYFIDYKNKLADTLQQV